jgi:hypothetical protein
MPVVARWAVAWPPLIATLALTVVAVEETGRDPWRLWPMQGIAVALLVAAAAWCLEEPVPEVARTTPRQLAWTLRARALGLVPAAGTWVLAALALGGELFGHRGGVLVQGLVGALAVVGAVALALAVGARRPGRAVVVGVVPVLLALAVVRPAAERLPVFPYGPTGPWEQSRTLWAVVAVGALLALVLGMAEAPWWAVRRSLGRGRATACGTMGAGRRPSSGGR